MTQNRPILSLGIMVADLVGRPLQAFPAAGRLVLLDEISLHTGGCAVNTASTLAHFDLPVEIIGRVGEDALGDFLLDALEKRGVGVGSVIRDPETGTSATMVMVDEDGERRFLHYIGANAHLSLDDVDFDLVRRAAILHVAGALVLPALDGEPTAELLRRAREAGVVTFLDTVWDATGRWMSVLRPVLSHVDYFVPSLPEARALTGREEPEAAARALLDAGVGTVGLKMGEEGALVVTDGALLRVPTYEVDVIDATGAGDAFAAGFITGVWKGWSLEKTTRFANAVGALCVTGTGAAGGIRSFAETLDFMESAPTKR